MDKIMKAVLFGVVFALVPLGLEAIMIAFGVGSRPLTVGELLQGGELFLVAAGMSAAALGDLMAGTIPPGSVARAIRIAMGAFCGIVIFIGGGAYGVLQAETGGASASANLPATNGAAVRLTARFATALADDWYVNVTSSGKRGGLKTVALIDAGRFLEAYKDLPNRAASVVKAINAQDSLYVTAALAPGATVATQLADVQGAFGGGRFSGGEASTNPHQSLTLVLSLVAGVIAAVSVIGTAVLLS